MANNIDVKKITGDINELNKSIKSTSDIMSQLIEKQNKLNKELSGAKNLKQVNDKLNKTKSNANEIEKEAEKLTKKRNSLIIKQDKSLRALTKDVIKQQEATKKLNQDIKAEGDAYQQLSNRLNRARANAKKLAAQYGTTSKQFKTAQKEVQGLDKRLKGIDKSLGQSQRNVGNYSGGFITAFKGIAAQLGLVGGVAVIVKTAFQSLFADQSSAEFFRVKLAGIKAQLDLIKDDVSEWGKSMTDSADDSESGFSKLTKAIGMFAKIKIFGLKKAVELMEIGEAAEDLEKRMISLEKTIADVNLQNAVRRRDIQELIFLTRQEDVSFEKRMQALKDANKLEKEILKTQVDNQRERVAILLGETKLTDEQIEQIANNKLQLEQVGLTKSTEEERVQTIAEITKLYEIQTLSLAKQRELLNRVNELTNKRLAVEKRIKDERAKETAIGDTIKSDPELIRQEELTDGIKDELQERYEANQKYLEQIESDEKKSIEYRKQLRDQFISSVGQTGNILFEITQNNRNRELDAIQNNYAAQIEAAEGNTELQEKLADDLASEQRRINREQAIADRNKALFNIAISQTQSAMRSAEIGFPQAIPFIAMAATFGLAQTAAVLNTPIPGFFTGTESAPTGLAYVAEKGRELIESDGQMFMADKPQLMDFKGGETVYNNADTERMLNAAIYKDIAINGNEGVEQRLDKLINKIDNQAKEVTVFDDDGIKRYLQTGNSKTIYLNKKGRK